MGMLLMIIVIGLALITIGVIVAGLWAMWQVPASRQPPGRPVGLSLEPAPALPSDLPWKRPYRVTWALTRKNVGLMMAGGLGLIVTLPFLLYWVSGFVAKNWSDLSPFGYIFMLPFVVIPLLILSWQGWLLVTGVRAWQRIKLLEARGQLTPGVMLDRWIRRGRGVAYCVAYYFEPPWESTPVVRAEMNPEAYRAYQVGEAVSVRYLPDNPKVCRVEI